MTDKEERRAGMGALVEEVRGLRTVVEKLDESVDHIDECIDSLKKSAVERGVAIDSIKETLDGQAEQLAMYERERQIASDRLHQGDQRFDRILEELGGVRKVVEQQSASVTSKVDGLIDTLASNAGMTSLQLQSLKQKKKDGD